MNPELYFWIMCSIFGMMLIFIFLKLIIRRRNMLNVTVSKFHPRLGDGYDETVILTKYSVPVDDLTGLICGCEKPDNIRYDGRTFDCIIRSET